MGRKGKQKRFAELATYTNVIQNYDFKNPELKNVAGETLDLKGKWATDFFKNNNPIILELACGKGDYSLGLARLFPQKNFIGIDIKGNRLWRGAKTALEEKLTNVGFLRTKIELITTFFAENEIDEIWITFPDPFPKSPNRRLSAGHFLDKYRSITKKEAIINFKTDDPDLYESSVEVVTAEQLPIIINEFDIDEAGMRKDELAIQTFYEKQHLAIGRKIKFLKFFLNRTH